MSARILVVDESPTGRIQWRARLSAAHYRVTLVDDLSDTGAALDLPGPDLILLSHRDLDEAIALCASIKKRTGTEDVPIILAGPDAGPDARLAALASGAADLLEAATTEVVCLARIRSLLRARDARAELLRRRSTAEEFGFCDAGAGFVRRGRVALVARSADVAEAWRATLADASRDRIDVLDEHRALSTAEQQNAADVYVIDIRADRTEEGLRFLADLRSRAETRRAAVIAVLRPGDSDAAVRALDLGASDLIRDDFRPGELAHRVRDQIRRKTEADALATALEDGMRMAATDPLTGLFNRRYAMTHAARILAAAEAGQRPVAVLIGDLDHFKRINDTWGHAAGDRVLIEVARRMRATLRGADVLARHGGEEFLVVMPDTDSMQAGPAAARLCQSVGATPIELGQGLPAITVTMSVGGASTAPGGVKGESIAGLIDRADRALYAAKAAGRNQITVDAAA